MAQITVPQAAERLGLSRSRVHQLIQLGNLPAERLGRDWLVEEDDLALVAIRRPAGRPPGPTPPRRTRRPR